MSWRVVSCLCYLSQVSSQLKSIFFLQITSGNFETIRGSLMNPKWQKLASLAQEICTLEFHFFGAVFASKGYPFRNIFPLVLPLSGNSITLGARTAQSVACLALANKIPRPHKFESAKLSNIETIIKLLFLTASRSA